MAFDLGEVNLLDLEEDKRDDLPPGLYVFDFETDPFLKWEKKEEQRIPQVFAVGVYNILTQEYHYHWGRGETREEIQTDCIDFLLSLMEAAEPGSMWWAHNGGKFDFHFFKEYIRGAMKIIGARIAQCRVGHVIVRDSFAMIPEALAKFGGKQEIDYALMEWPLRERPDIKAKILSYMKDDCLVLAKAVWRFISEFGLNLTMASAAMKQLQRFHEIDRLGSLVEDERFRKFYYGGRVETLESGVLEGNWKLYDVNGMYAAVMRNVDHPVSESFIKYDGKYATTAVDRGVADFAEIEAINHGCLPCRLDGKLTFRNPRGRFFATGHEILAGLETGTLQILKVHQAFRGERHTNFAAFVDHFDAKRMEAKALNDELMDLYYKRVRNSAYGKFAQDPARFKDWELTEEIKETSEGWVLEHTFPDRKTFIWSRPSITPAHLMRFNVATAASITGAARALLWRGMVTAKRPIYCDTDSLICEEFHGDVDPKRLGAWKFECEARTVAIAGRKLYAMFGDGVDGPAIKQAAKGVRVTAQAIANVAAGIYPERDGKGGYLPTRNDAPTFSLKKKTHFISRKVRRTS